MQKQAVIISINIIGMRGGLFNLILFLIVLFLVLPKNQEGIFRGVIFLILKNKISIVKSDMRLEIINNDIFIFS